jgi:Uma2 family endonuclease
MDHSHLATRQPPGKMSYEEFLAWCDEDTWAEWVEGEVIMVSPASERHQDLQRFLQAVLGIFVEQHGLGRILSAPFQMRLSGSIRSGREPDVLFIAQAHLERLRETYLDGPADVVVEIVSAESGPRDRGEKFYEYEAGGVQEYWLIDPERQQAEFYQRGADGRYRLNLGGAEGVYRATAVPGFWLKVEWLWQRPLPRVLDALRELGVL